LTSHVPHLLAFALAQASVVEDEARTPIGERPGRGLLAFAGPSFRSATRVASSSPETWRDILLHNRSAVLHALDQVKTRLDALSAAVREQQPDELQSLIAASGGLRRRVEASDDAPQVTRVERVAPARGPLRGAIEVPGDKSIAHRALLFGGIARGTTLVRGVGGGEDNASTMRVLRRLGVAIERGDGAVRVAGRGFAGLEAPNEVLDCANSGTTLRLMCGLLAGRPFASRLTGDASLRRRPMRRVIEPLTAMGASFDSDEGRPPVTVHGAALRGGAFRLQVASAQVKTCLVLAALQAEGETTIEEPALSRDHTERLLPAFGGTLERRAPLVIAVRGPQELHGAEISVPGDPSSAAFWLVAASIVPGSRVSIRGVGVNPTRSGAIDVLRAMGARIRETPRPSIGEEPVADLEVEAAALHGTTVAGETMLRAIDEFPVLAVAAAYARGETSFADAGELRVKESDRIAAMAAGLSRLGVAVEELRDGLVVRGGRGLRGGDVEAHGDHRIAMAFAVAALGARGEIAIHGAESIAVSYPEFPATLESLRRGAAP
jgi:3-phosphoshikimate 1-carboxyvinyltransferase